MQLSQSKKQQAGIGLITLAYIAFISLGLPDGLLGVAYPSIRANFSLPLDALGVLLVSGMVGYSTSGFLSGKAIARFGVGGVLAMSCALTGASLLAFTVAPSWAVFVGIGALVGFGAGAIDAGINTYIASEHGEGLMQWLHASFGVGITLGPIIMTAGLSLFESWRWGYSVVGSAQILLALCFFATRSMWRRRSTDDDGQEKPRLIDFKTPLRESLRRPSTWLSMLLFFFYTGVEVTLGNWVYTLLTESRGIAPAVAGLWAGSYWGMFTVGRLLAGIYTRRIKSHTLMKISLLGAFAGSLLLWWNPSDVVSLAGVAVVGFAIAPIFPGLVSGTSARVSPSHAANTIGMQISAAGLGGTGLSALAGVLANRFSLEIIPVYLVTAIVVLFGLYTLSMWGKTSA